MMSSISSAEFKIRQSDFFGDKSLCDITLTDGSGELQVRAHQLVLSAQSDYFSSMFSGSFKEAGSSEVKLDEINGKILEVVIGFIYSNEIKLESGTVEDVLRAANFLQIRSLEEECSDYLRKQFDTCNVLGILVLAEQYSNTYLYNFAFEFACQHFTELHRTEDFFSLDIHQLTKLISSDNLCVSSEDDVFHAIWGWIQHDRLNREKCIDNLFQHLRVSMLTPGFIPRVVERYIKTSECLELIVNAYKRQSLRPKHQTKRRVLKEILIAIEVKPHSKWLTIMFYSPSLKKWTHTRTVDFQERGAWFGSTTLDEKLYIAGGTMLDGRITNRVDCLDLQRNRWTELSPLLTARVLCAMTTLNGHLYVVGGRDSADANLNSVEKWDPLIGNWEYIAPMRKAASYPIVGVKGSSLCVALEADNNERILDIYDPLTKEWTYEWSRVKDPLFGVTTVSINGVDHFYTISETEIKMFNLENNSTKIISVNCMNSLFTRFTLLNDSFIIYTKSKFRRYWPINNEWETLPDLNTGYDCLYVMSYGALVNTPVICLNRVGPFLSIGRPI